MASELLQETDQCEELLARLRLPVSGCSSSPFSIIGSKKTSPYPRALVPTLIPCHIALSEAHKSDGFSSGCDVFISSFIRYSVLLAPSMYRDQLFGKWERHGKNIFWKD